MTDGASAQVTLKEVYTLLLEVKGELTGLPEDVRDHEARIRALEKLVWVACAVGAGGGAGLSQLLTALPL